MLKTFPSDKVNGTRNVFFFLSLAPTLHSFTQFPISRNFLILKRHNFFKTKITRTFAPRPGVKFFKLKKSKSWEGQIFVKVTFKDTLKAFDILKTSKKLYKMMLFNK